MAEEQQQPAATEHHGVEGHFKKHWAVYLIGIGAATLVVIMVHNYNSQNQPTMGAGGPTYSGTIPSDQLPGAQIEADIGNLQKSMDVQTSFLQTIANAFTNPAPTTNGGGTTVTGTSNAQSIFPLAKGTAGFSNNFWVYTTKAGDSATSLNNMANWSQHGPGYFENYRNNAAILANIGYDFSHPNSPLPVGTKVNL